MTMSPTIRIRHLKSEDVPEVQQLVTDVQNQSAQQELRIHLYRFLAHPYLPSIILLAYAIIICVTQTSYVKSSLGAIILVAIIESIRFNVFWRRIRKPFQPGKDLQNLLSYYSDINRFFLVAEIEGAVVGTVAVWQTNDDLTAKLTRMFVNSRYRRMGIGTRLIQSCIEECIKVGYSTLMLRTHVTNQKAIKCYEKAGFVRTGGDNFAKLYPHTFDTVNYHLDLTNK